MKIQLIGHDEKYAVEQSLLALFPEERPVYGDVDPAVDTRWMIVSLREDEADGKQTCHVTTELGWDGQCGPYTMGMPLTGTEYEKEGLRRRCMGLSIFRAAHTVLGIAPPWGSLTGVRPGKIAARSLERCAANGRPDHLAEKETMSLMTNFYSVTPARARLAVESAKAGLKAKRELAPRDIAAYIGIPFCPTRCAYCSFVSASVERSFALVEPYLDVLCDEVRAAGAMVREQGLRTRAFYMGGGTPTTLTADQMDRLLTVFEESFDLTACSETTIEAGRPDTITPEKLAVLKKHGITRVSVNPQTMEDRVLEAIGRRHSADDIRRCMEQVAAAGFEHVNMDLIAGLPEDTPEGFRRSLDECLTFGADNITVHTLSLKKGSAILTRGLSIPDAAAVGEMLDYADPTLRKAGMEPYYLYRQKYMSGSFENVGWCRPGAENLYNIYIMEELCSILSMGAGGSTKMVDLPGNRICRAFNLKYPKEYTERPEKWAANQAEFAAFYQK